MPNMTEQQWRDYNARMNGIMRSPIKFHDCVENESDLHNAIIDFCKERGWIALHGSTAHRTYRTLGESDFCCVLPFGLVLFVECKTKTGKLTQEQQVMAAWLKRLGNEMHVVRSLQEFQQLCDGKLQSVNSSAKGLES